MPPFGWGKTGIGYPPTIFWIHELCVISVIGEQGLYQNQFLWAGIAENKTGWIRLALKESDRYHEPTRPANRVYPVYPNSVVARVKF